MMMMMMGHEASMWPAGVTAAGRAVWWYFTVATPLSFLGGLHGDRDRPWALDSDLRLTVTRGSCSSPAAT